jgi:hypothetical protein
LIFNNYSGIKIANTFIKIDNPKAFNFALAVTWALKDRL